MLRISKEKNIIMLICPLLELYFKWTSSHNNQWNILQFIPNFH